MPTAFKHSDPNEAALAYFSKVEQAFSDLTDSYRAYECLQSFLSPRLPPLDGGEEFHIEPEQLRGLVTVLNGDMTRQLQALRGAILGVRERMKVVRQVGWEVGGGRRQNRLLETGCCP